MKKLLILTCMILMTLGLIVSASYSYASDQTPSTPAIPQVDKTTLPQALSRHRVWTIAALIWSKYLVKAGQLLVTKGSLRVPESVRWKPR